MTKSDRIDRILEKTAQDRGDAVFWITDGGETTYGEFYESVKRLAGSLLAVGIQKGDRVGIWMSNRLEFTQIEMAANVIGAVGVPISTRYKSNELEYILRHSGVKILFMADRLVKIDFMGLLAEILPSFHGRNDRGLPFEELPSLRHIVSVGDSDSGQERPPVVRDFEDFLLEGESPAIEKVLAEVQKHMAPVELSYIQYTSGSTGLPKGVMYSHEQVLLSVTVGGERWELTPDDRMLVVAPFYHGLGHMAGPPMAVRFGASVVPLEVFDAGQALRMIGEHRCTTLSAPPTVFQMMLEHPDFERADLSSLRAALITAAPSPQGLKTKIMECFPATRLKSGYGSTETGGGCTQSTLTDSPELIENSIGLPLRTYEVKITNPDTGQVLPPNTPGELCSRGPCIMLGYYKEDEKTSRVVDEQGWFHSGDLARIDDKGYLRIVGRLKEMIITGGNNVYPVEVESLLEKHPAVKEAQVVGTPDEVKGETIAAFLILEEGKACLEEEIREFCRGRISNYKVPQHIRFLDAFPISAAGKILKEELKKMKR
ncbi:MAG: AMP-binding protein [Proteobacteria bacterium]|nr:AMP-binding protein [Pseudomonadota bacterium]